MLVWREKLVENRIGEWVGPYIVLSQDTDAKIIVVQLDAQAQVKPFLDAEPAASHIMSTVAPAIRKYASEPTPDDCYVTEVIHENDPRSHTPEMEAAKMREVRDLLKRGTFKVILKEELPHNANALPAHFVLAIMSTVDG